MSLEVLIPIAVFLGAFGLLAALVWAAKLKLRRNDRRSPFTKDMLRGPGHSLRERIDELGLDFSAHLALAPVVPLVLYASYLQQRLLGSPPSRFGIAIYLVVAIAFVGYTGWKMIGHIRELRDCRLGLEAEITVAEELNRLMQHGYTVFHDLPGDGPFNVDHVLVGPTGIFAVETKGRMKVVDPAVRDGHVVYSNGVELKFPAWKESEPINQAERNSKWLSKWLASATGESVWVQPIVVLPGWLVNLNAAGGVPVLNPGQVLVYLRSLGTGRLSERQIGQICHQLEARCRTVRSTIDGARTKAS